MAPPRCQEPGFSPVIDDKPMKITSVVISTQHAAAASNKTIRDFITKQVIQKVLPKKMLSRTRRFS
ncbi:MAG: hypothetical protein CM1200mP29_09990 [Verrucomicrobiota bacterium]|nr:MAG: hypothetical protein CM1200mP29_09990 [Verrucomicrobiota bacterium]